MTEPSTPFPRARPLRLLTAAGAMVLALAGLWLAWSHAASRRLQARVEAIVARHEPIDPRDFETAPVPPAQNAATYYQKATSAMSRTVWPPSSSSLFYKNYPPFPPAWRPMAEQAVAANGPTLLLARQACPYDRVDWGVSAPAFFNLLNVNRSLANLLADAALLAHFQGDDAEAIERVRDVLHLAEAVDAGPAGGTGHAVAIGIDALAEDRLEVMAPDLRIDVGTTRPPPATGPAGLATPVSRRAILALVAELLDDRRLLNRRRHAVMVSRSIDLGYYQGLQSRATLLRPMVNLETDRILEDYSFLLRAVEQPNFAASEQVMAQRPRQPSVATDHSAPSWTSVKDPKPPRYSHLFTRYEGQPGPYTAGEWHWVTERRAAATDLAVQLYRTDHHRWPPSLHALVPAYLPAVPEDPFDPSNQPLRYVILPASPGGAERPLIYFRLPADGQPGLPPDEPTYGARVGPNQWRDVSRLSPPAASPQTAPATQT